MNTPPKAPCHSCNGTGIDPTVGFLDCEFCTPAFAGVSLSAPEQPEPTRTMCNDHGEIGCLRSGGYDSERCPDCNPATCNKARRRAAAIEALKPENQRIVPCNTDKRPDYFKCLKVD